MTDRPTLVLLHAFPLTSAIYTGRRAALADVAELITPDFRGFGSMPLGDSPPSLDLLADDVADLLDRHHVDRAVVGGTSMGGYVTLALLRRHPERVSAALLANTRAGADAPETRDNRLRIAETVVDVGVAEALAEMLPKLLGATTRERRADLAERVRRWVTGAAPESVAWAQRAMAARPASFQALVEFPRPVLVIAGAEDELMPLDEAAAMASAASRGRLEVLPETGHLACLEQPESWDAIVSGWLNTL